MWNLSSNLILSLNLNLWASPHHEPITSIVFHLPFLLEPFSEKRSLFPGIVHSTGISV